PCRTRLPVARDEFSHAVGWRVWLRLQRFALEVVIDVADQGFNGSVSALRIPVHCGETQHVEVRPFGLTGRGTVVTVLRQMEGSVRDRRRFLRFLLRHYFFGL